MFAKIKQFLYGIVLKKYVLGWVTDLYSKMEGYKTQFSAVAMVAVTGAYLQGWLTESQWNTAMALLGGWGSVALAEKLKRNKPLLDALKKK